MATNVITNFIYEHELDVYLLVYDKEAFDIYMEHPYHKFINSINGTEDDCFITEGFYSCQIEYEN